MASFLDQVMIVHGTGILGKCGLHIQTIVHDLSCQLGGEGSASWAMWLGFASPGQACVANMQVGVVGELVVQDMRTRIAWGTTATTWSHHPLTVVVVARLRGLLLLSKNLSLKRGKSSSTVATTLISGP